MVVVDHEKLVSVLKRQHKSYEWKTLEDGSRVMIDPTGHQPPMIHLAGDDKYKMPSDLRKTKRRGVPRAYKYPVFEGFVALLCLMVVFLILFIAFAVMYSQ